MVVKVNDRGPFATNRIIDLSYVAAKKLGMIGHGTAYVRVKAIDPYRYEKRLMLADKSVYLQIGAFHNRSNAEKQRRQLASLLSTPIYIADPSYRSNLYRVQVGPIQDIATANKISNRLRVLGIKSNKRYGV